MGKFDEFEYDYNDFMKPEELCIECNKKFKNKNGVNMCRSCFQEYLITKTNAKRLYKLKDEDLKDLHEFSCSIAFSGGQGTSYLLREVRMKMIEINFDVYEPMEIEEYQKYVKKFLRKIDREQEKKQEKKIMNRKNRKNKLKLALEQRGLELRSDSYYCNKYIDSNMFSLRKVCDMMEIMHFLFNKTDYTKILDDIREDILDEYRYKFDDPELYMHVSLNETHKEMAKETAVDNYVKKYGKKKLPKAVLKYFFKNKTKKAIVKI